ncbi:MAG: 3-hydroxy-3-methylglutaryl-CoA reductase [Verrucomicrobia bacterium]|nr:MAG: 3-hydroxy-3-methylglutaryl-CoA reductase [Verrucomicrobiota bacterium]
MNGKHILTMMHASELLQARAIDEIMQRLAPDFDDLPAFPKVTAKVSAQAINRTWNHFPHDPAVRRALLDASEDTQAYEGNIENMIGLIKIPLGVAGPLRVRGLAAYGDYAVPLATSEAALVASYHRGCRVINESGGCTTLILSECVTRSPAFIFATATQSARFVLWVLENFSVVKGIAESTTAHGRLTDIGCIVEGNHAYLNLEYTTGDAAGQNMVTIATQAVCDWVGEHCPLKPEKIYVEGNASGDKKASAKSFMHVRGKKVSAEVLVPGLVLKQRLHVTAKEMEQYWRVSAIGGVLSGTIGVHGHFANGLAALYLATGQDVACVAESAVGVTRFEARDDGSLYATVTLPSIIAGTVGGGTSMPTAAACLDLMGLRGAGKARAFAEVCAALLLGGELSIIAAMAAGHFSRAHKKLARKKP